MKRILSLVLALALSLSLMALSVSAAAGTVSSPGDLFEDNGGVLGEAIGVNDDVAPGQTIYVALAKYDANDKGTRVKKVALTAERNSDKTVFANSKDVEVVRLREGSGDRWTFAVLKVKTISASTYSDDGPFSYEGELTVRFEDGTTSAIAVSIDRVAYEEVEGGFGTLSSTPKLFKYEKGDEIDLDSESGYLTIEGEASGSAEVIASVSTETIDAIEDKYGEKATLTYYTCDGSFKRIKNAKVCIDAEDTYKYLYTYSGNKLTEVSKAYNSSDDEFVMSFGSSGFTLGTYVLSDKKLSGAAASSSSEPASTPSEATSTPASQASNVQPSATVNPGYVPRNPSTGAAL